MLSIYSMETTGLSTSTRSPTWATILRTDPDELGQPALPACDEQELAATVSIRAYPRNWPGGKYLKQYRRRAIDRLGGDSEVICDRYFVMA
jgi:hypothetical protein